ncbi:MAG: hypothetical protein B7Z37_03925 [Verrucomicrobia bacterium 12-59-8]|nr:MAG: hypothetical protein B7Z37_03925 [Verrucomicrobia bacterium 12-59-8]
MKTPSHLPRLLCLALALAWTQGTQASTVFWGSNFNDDLFDSSGNTLDATYSFEIGTFTGGFTPSYLNVDQWEANWHVIDRAFDPDSNGWNATEQFFVGTVGFNTDGTSDSTDANPADVFIQDDVVYLWAFNSKTIVPSSEWALVTDGTTAGNTGDPWVVPNPADTVGSYNWNLSDASTTVIGGANGVQGDGTYSATPPVFSLQTAVVPEPGSAFLLLAAAVAHLARRARRMNRMSLL